MAKKTPSKPKRSIRKAVKPSKRKARSKRLRSRGRRMSDKALSRSRSKQKKSKRRGKTLRGGAKIKTPPRRSQDESTPPSVRSGTAGRKAAEARRRGAMSNFRRISKKGTQQARRAKSLANRMGARPGPRMPTLTPGDLDRLDMEYRNSMDEIDAQEDQGRLIERGSRPFDVLGKLPTHLLGAADGIMRDNFVDPFAEAVQKPRKVVQGWTRRGAAAAAEALDNPWAAVAGTTAAAGRFAQYAAIPPARTFEYLTNQELHLTLDKLHQLKERKYSQLKEIQRITNEVVRRARTRAGERARGASASFANYLRDYAESGPSDQAHPI